MKIIIEHEDATASCIGEGPAALFRGGEEVVLDLAMERQALERWCWAAIAVSLSAYYHSKTISQHDVATLALGFDCSGFSGNEALKERCDINFSLDKVLELLHCFSHWSLGKPHFERVQFEIANGRPVCCRINWYKGDAHYVLIKGYNMHREEIYLEDPLHGSSAIRYHDFPAKYKVSGGAWTETYWTMRHL